VVVGGDRAALTTTRRLVPVARMASRMLAVPAEMIDDACQ
jgi:hypothetical protein